MPNPINHRVPSFWGLIAAQLENNLKILQKPHCVAVSSPKITGQNGPDFILPLKG